MLNWKVNRMHNFLCIFHIPELNINKAINLDRPITPIEIEAVIKSMPTTTKSQHQMVLVHNSTRLSKRVNAKMSQIIP